MRFFRCVSVCAAALGAVAFAAPPVPVFSASAKPDPVDLAEYRMGDSFEAIYPPTVRASSSLAASGANRYSAKMLTDGDVRTAWVEGARGSGTGEWIEWTFDRTDEKPGDGRETAVAVTDLYLFNGYRKGDSAWRNNGRVRSFDLYIGGKGGKKIAALKLLDTKQYQSVAIPRTVLTPGKKTVLRLVVTGAYRGSGRATDTAVSEAEWIGEGVF
ncbi:MAG: hypothetical protein H7Y38_19505 [Armatimonadetes bacterium]|nr:hypothetical protein [Armatimonadota bacterium]